MEAKYTNYFNIGHNAHEFVLDFGQFYSEEEHAQLHTRLVVGPTFARALAALLKQSLETYESSHGAIAPLKESAEIDPRI